MNKARLAFACILITSVFVTGKSYGQDTSGFVGFKTPKMPYSKQHILKSNLVPVLVGQIPFCGEIRLTYEHAVAHNQSILVGASYNFPNLIILQMVHGFFHDYSMRGARGMLGYRIYPLKKQAAPKGFFFGPYFSYNFVKLAEKHANPSYEVINYFNAGVITGYQVIKKHFVLEFFGGLGYRKNFITQYDSRLNQTYAGNFPGALTPPGLGRWFENLKILLQVNFGYAF